MFFFRIEISSFDDESKTLFVVPDQNADEQGIPFDEKMLTQEAEYKAFLKETGTCIVDVKYTQYKTDEVVQSLDEKLFEQLNAEGKLSEIDNNSFSITTNIKPKKSVGKKDMKMYFIIGGAAVLLVVLLIISSAVGKKDNTSDNSSISENSESLETSSEASEESTDSEVSENTDNSSENSPDNSEYIDTPPDGSGTDVTDEDGYTDTGYAQTSNTSSGGSVSGKYTISFSANGGTGTLDSISSQSGQYVTLPSAETASKSISKKGYKLIGFSDNTEIPYPLYHYKMPSQNVTLFAVWEPDTFSVTYNSNGGTGTLSRAEVKYDDNVPLPADAAIYKDGFFLSGWAKTDSANYALKSLKMPAENLTLYAVWSKQKPTAKISLHYDDKIQVLEKEIGSTVDMLDSFGVTKDGFSVEGWYLENSPKRLESLYISGNCDVYAKWQEAEYITVTIDRSYLNKSAETYKLPLDMTGAVVLKLPKVDDKNDIYNHVAGCTYGYSSKKQSGEFGTIEYFGDTEYKFKANTTLYRVLNKYGGGDGTKENPYIISYYDQLVRLSEEKANGYFKQTSDIKFPSDIDRKPIDTKQISRGYENKSYNFFVYDGGNYTIKGLSGVGGLFGNIAGSTITNVVIDGAKISAGDYANVGILCNEISSYPFPSDSGANYATGNSKILNCTVKNGKIEGGKAKNAGGICGYGGIISNCYVSEIGLTDGECVGGIVGNACTVTGSLANGVTVNGKPYSAGGIAGTAFGTEIYDGGKSYITGGSIIGCGVRTFSASAENSGGIIGTATADTNEAFIKSCYVANIYLNGKNNGGIAGADGDKLPHRITYCLVDSTNKYSVVGGENVRSVSKSMVLSVPADSGLTVDGVLSVLNATASGFDEWKRSDNANSGYPYPSKISIT